VVPQPPGPDPDRPLRLRVTFTASSLAVAVDVASQLRAATDLPVPVERVDTLAHLDLQAADIFGLSPAPNQTRAWSVEATLAPMPLGGLPIQMLERRMLSLEYRWAGCRFLGFTTDAIPGIASRSAPRDQRQRGVRAGDGDVSPTRREPSGDPRQPRSRTPRAAAPVGDQSISRMRRSRPLLGGSGGAGHPVSRPAVGQPAAFWPRAW
jgi:hypothetical protein